MKYEWKKHEKEIYGINTKPCIIDIAPQNYITVSGNGNPNHKVFSEKVSALFSVAYKIKTAYKLSAEKDREITDYSVYPLEGIWSKTSEKETLVKEELQYRIMIRQPNFITKEMFEHALEEMKRKKDNLYFADISFETICDGKCIQILHKGTYDNEPESFKIMNDYCVKHGYKRLEKEHREIYLNNASRTEKNNLKTILRYKVINMENSNISL